MITKLEAHELINKYFFDLRKWLKIPKKIRIDVHLLSTASKKTLKKKGIMRANEMGCSYISTSGNGVDVVLYYNQHPTTDEFISTMIHELLHIKLDPLTDLVTIACNRANRMEEKIVLDLERILMNELVTRRKLMKSLKRIKK